MTRAVLTPRAVWWRARAPVGLSKLCQLLALSAWHGIAQERSAGSSIKQISALTHFRAHRARSRPSVAIDWDGIDACCADHITHMYWGYGRLLAG